MLNQLKVKNPYTVRSRNYYSKTLRLISSANYELINTLLSHIWVYHQRTTYIYISLPHVAEYLLVLTFVLIENSWFFYIFVRITMLYTKGVQFLSTIQELAQIYFITLSSFYTSSLVQHSWKTIEPNSISLRLTLACDCSKFLYFF